MVQAGLKRHVRTGMLWCTGQAGCVTREIRKRHSVNELDYQVFPTSSWQCPRPPCRTTQPPHLSWNLTTFRRASPPRIRLSISFLRRNARTTSGNDSEPCVRSRTGTVSVIPACVV